MRAKTLNGGFQLNCHMLCDITYPHIPVTEVSFQKSYTECGLIFLKESNVLFGRVSRQHSDA